MALRLSTGLRNMLLGSSASMLTNGTFDSATTGWTAVTATLSSSGSGQDGNCLRVAANSAAVGQAYQDITTVVGRIYELTFYFKVGTSSSGSARIGTTTDDDAIATTAALSDASWTQYRVQFRATETTTRITMQTDDATDTEYSEFDTIVVNEILDGFQEIMRNCQINVYTGSQPADADTAASGTLLVTYTESGGANGLTWGDVAAGVIAKTVSETWQGTAVADGTAGWFRCFAVDDTPANASTTAARFDGNIATSGADLNMSNTTMATGGVQTLSGFSLTLPAS